MKPPWVIRQETEIDFFYKALTKSLAKRRKPKSTSLAPLLKHAERNKKYDVYESTTMEGYIITPEEVERTLRHPRTTTHDKTTLSLEKLKNKMAILGHAHAFSYVKKAIETNFGHAMLSEKLIQNIYYRLFKPTADLGLIEKFDLIGYRRIPVYIRGARYVPPAYEKLNDLMENYVEKINAIAQPLIKAILAHYFFVTIHPYPDGNGRCARLIMNFLFMTAGHHWTTIPSTQRENYFDALQQGQIHQDILPFAHFILNLIG